MVNLVRTGLCTFRIPRRCSRYWLEARVLGRLVSKNSQSFASPNSAPRQHEVVEVDTNLLTGDLVVVRRQHRTAAGLLAQRMRTHGEAVAVAAAAARCGAEVMDGAVEDEVDAVVVPLVQEPTVPGRTQSPLLLHRPHSRLEVMLEV